MLKVEELLSLLGLEVEVRQFSMHLPEVDNYVKK
jgi:hypothetical protein